MKEAAVTWGDEFSFYLKAAVRFSSEFNGWGGFGPLDEEGMDLREREKDRNYMEVDPTDR